jgi:tetratricopeptide (TPR) repeat protein
MKIKNCIVILFIYIVIILNWNNVIAQNTNTIDSIKNVIKNAKNDTIRIKEYLKWDELIYLQYPDTSIYINLKVCKIAEIILKKSQSIDFAKSTKKYYADALNNLGYIYDTKGDVSKALECYGKSLKIQEEIKNKHGIASSLNNIGYVYDNLGNIPVALEYYSKSLKIKEESNDLNGMANSFNNIGTIYQNQGDANKALEYYNKSLKIQEKIGNTEGVAVAFNNIGMIYNYQANKAFLKKDI